MSFNNEYLNNQNYNHLPAYSKFLLSNHLEDFVKEQIEIAREAAVPVLKLLTHFSEEQLIELTKVSMMEYLQYLIENNAKDQIEHSIQKWKSDQLEIVGKFDLVAEDITLINYSRGKALRKFIPLYTNNTSTAFELIDEIDKFLMSSTTAATNTYIFILKEEIEKHEKQLLEAQAISSIGSFDWNIVTGISANSPQLYKIFEMDNHLGVEKFLDNVHDEDRNNVKDALTEAFVSGYFESEYKYIINNKTKYLWSRGKVFKNEDGKPQRLVGTVQDITERKIIENELSQKTQALQIVNQNLEQFTYAASHDLKEPVRKIHLFSTRLKESLSQKMDDNEKSYFDKIEKSALRMKVLIDSLLEYSTASQSSIELEEIDLNIKIGNVLEDLEVLIQEKEAIIQYDKLPTIKGHPRQLRQLFQNLIDNALKYRKPDVKPVIQITCNKVSGNTIKRNIPETDRYKYFYLIQVKDNGVGFDQKDAEKIFNVFTRLHADNNYRGSGIGLSIVQKVVKTHNGYVVAESSPGEGSTFKVYLPAI